LQVIDVNDNVPQVSLSETSISIIESATKGTKLLTAMASDRDSGDNGAAGIKYTLTNDEGRFSIDATGTVSLLAALDRETKDSYTVTVIATDGGSPALSGSATFDVEVRRL